MDCDSPAEQFGLKAGDQILDVNGHNFLSILHQEAVTILRTYTTLIMTIRVSRQAGREIERQCLCIGVKAQDSYNHFVF